MPRGNPVLKGDPKRGLERYCLTYSVDARRHPAVRAHDLISSVMDGYTRVGTLALGADHCRSCLACRRSASGIRPRARRALRAQVSRLKMHRHRCGSSSWASVSATSWPIRSCTCAAARTGGRGRPGDVKRRANNRMSLVSLEIPMMFVVGYVADVSRARNDSAWCLQRAKKLMGPSMIWLM
jgi:hypothetical protein